MKTFSLVFLAILLTCVLGQHHPKARKPPRSYNSEYPELRSGKITKPDDHPQVEFPSGADEDCSLKCLDQRYLQHYLALGCRPVSAIDGTSKCACPKYYECPEQRPPKNMSNCNYGGKQHPIGGQVPVENPCQRCQCVDRNFNDPKKPEPEVACASVECPEHLVGHNYDFAEAAAGLNDSVSIKLATKNCYRVSEPGKCCTSRRCPTDGQLRKMRRCQYKDRVYKEGEMISLTEDPCQQCICSDGWNNSDPTKSRGCSRFKCDLEIELAKKKGCIPIYHEGSCCPIDYHCPPPKEQTCFFDGVHHQIGAKLDISNNCVECECRVPPTFTCIQRRCLTPDDPSCTLHYEDGQCCPRVECPSSKNTTSDHPDEPAKVQCPPPVPGGLACAGYKCETVLDEFGCQACKCERECPELNCGDGCHIFAVTPGECPRCSC